MVEDTPREGCALPEAPTFYPTAEEWANPGLYITQTVCRIPYLLGGTARIVPPASAAELWSQEESELVFSCRLESVGCLASKWTSGMDRLWADDYGDFCQSRRLKVPRRPQVAGVDLDLFAVFSAVVEAGGWSIVDDMDRWPEIASRLQLGISDAASRVGLREVYRRLLLAYEDQTVPKTADERAALLPIESLEGVEEESDEDLPKADISGGAIDDDEAALVLGGLCATSPSLPGNLASGRHMITVGNCDRRSKTSMATSADESEESSPGRPVPRNISTMVCEACGGGHAEDRIVLCDHCNLGWHLFCLDPPLTAVPAGDWICPRCALEEIAGSCFPPSKDLTLDEFAAAARNFQAKWLDCNCSSSPSKEGDVETLEHEFWAMVDQGLELAEVLTGSIEGSRTHGGAALAALLRPHCLSEPKEIDPGHGWPSSSLEVGMRFSARPWASEMDETHGIWALSKAGEAPMVVYTIPASTAEAFRATIQRLYPLSCRTCSSLPDEAQLLPSPRVLSTLGLPVMRTRLAPGDWLVTLPGVTSASVWSGFGALVRSSPILPSSISRSAARLARCVRLRVEPGWDHADALLKWASASDTCWSQPEALKQICDELRHVACAEHALRERLWAGGTHRARAADAEERRQKRCTLCRARCGLSFVECVACGAGKRAACIPHAGVLCDCPPSAQRLVYGLSTRELKRAERAARARLRELLSHQEAAEQDVASFLDAVAARNAGVEEKREVSSKQEVAAELASLKEDEPSTSSSCSSGRDQQHRYLAKLEESGHDQEEEEPSIHTSSSWSSDTLPELDKLAIHRRDTFLCAENDSCSSDPPTSVRARLAETCELWQERCEATLETGGHLAADLPELLEESEQYRWGAVCAAYERAATALADRLEKAQGYLEAITQVVRQASLNSSASKPLAEEIEALLNETPVPLKNPPGLDRLQELGSAAREWRAKAREALDARITDSPPSSSGNELVSLADFDALLVEASSIPVVLPEAREIRERMATARWLGEAIRGALPPSPSPGKEGAKPPRRKRDELALLLDAGPVGERKHNGRKNGDDEKMKRDAPLNNIDSSPSTTTTTTVEHLRDLCAQATSLRCEVPDLASLTAALNNLESWSSHARDLLRTRAPLDRVQALILEGAALPAVMPELASLRAAERRGETWRGNMRALLAGSNTPLKRLRDALHAGLRLPVEVEEVAELRAAIRSREWEEQARRTLGGRSALHALREALAAASDVGAENAALAEKLREKIGLAEEWELQAEALTTRIEDAKNLDSSDTGSLSCTMRIRDVERHRPDLALLEAIVEAGTAVGVRMERLGALSSSLSRAQIWLEHAQDAVMHSIDAQSSDGHQEFDAEDRRVQHSGRSTVISGDRQVLPDIQDESMVLASVPPVTFHDSISLTTPRAFSKYDDKKAEIELPTIASIESLLKTYCKEIVVRMDVASQLSSRLHLARSWLEAARPLLQAITANEKVPELELESLLARGRSIPVAMEEYDRLHKQMQGLLWNRRVREMAERLMHQAESPGVKVEAEASSTTSGEMLIERLGPSNDSSVKHQQSGSRISLDEGVALLQQGHDLRDIIDPSLLDWLQSHVDAGVAWQGVARQVLAAGQLNFHKGQDQSATKRETPTQVEAQVSPGGPVDIVYLECLVQRGETLLFGQGELPMLESVLTRYRNWEKQVLKLRDSTGLSARPAYNELATLWQEVSALPVTSTLCQHIQGALVHADDWLDKCRRAVVKRNSGILLLDALEILCQTVEDAVVQFEHHLELEKKLVAAAKNVVKGEQETDNAFSQSSSTLYCLCQRTYEADSNMISCDTCGEWFHMRCVGLTVAQSKSLKTYTCPICAAVNGDRLEPLNAALSKIRRTRRPSRVTLGGLLEQTRALSVSLSEEPVLARVLTKFDRWATAASRAMEVHEASRLLETGDQILPLSKGMLYQLLRSALSLEVDAGAVAERILRLLRANRWREKVEIAFQNGKKPEVEVTKQLAMDGEGLNIVLETDVGGCILASALTAYSAWHARGVNLLAILSNASASTEQLRGASAEAAVLVDEASSLPLLVTEEAEALKEKSTLYCLCRKPYDEQRPMLGCDACSDWFHYECVGLQPPGDDGPGVEDDAFECPACCRYQNKPYQAALPQASLRALVETRDNEWELDGTPSSSPEIDPGNNSVQNDDQQAATVKTEEEGVTVPRPKRQRMAEI